MRETIDFAQGLEPFEENFFKERPTKTPDVVKELQMRDKKGLGKGRICPPLPREKGTPSNLHVFLSESKDQILVLTVLPEPSLFHGDRGLGVAVRSHLLVRSDRFIFSDALLCL